MVEIDLNSEHTLGGSKLYGVEFWSGTDRSKSGPPGTPGPHLTHTRFPQGRN